MNNEPKLSKASTVRRFCEIVDVVPVSMHWVENTLVVDLDEAEMKGTHKKEFFAKLDRKLEELGLSCVIEVVQNAWHEPMLIVFSWEKEKQSVEDEAALI